MEVAGILDLQSYAGKNYCRSLASDCDRGKHYFYIFKT